MAVEVAQVGLATDVGAWFTGRDRARQAAVGRAGNVSHHRPHLPAELARTRREVADRIGCPVDSWHMMRQVHGAAVGIVDTATPPGAQLDGVDALVTTEPDRALVVQVADCVPVLLAGAIAVGAVHAGRRGVLAGVVDAAVDAVHRADRECGASEGQARAVIGPAIGGCCYEVPHELRESFVDRLPSAVSSTTWGTPSVDLVAAVRAQLESRQVEVVGGLAGCTRCDQQQRWFSHRADPDTGRFAGIVVRYAGTGSDG